MYEQDTSQLVFGLNLKEPWMNWGKVFYIFFTLMSLTTSAAFLYESSLAADSHLIPAFFVFKFYGNESMATGLVIGAVAANLYTIFISMIESAKEKADF